MINFIISAYGGFGAYEINFTFVNGYGSSTDNFAYGINIISNNDILVVGKDADGMIMKMDPSGNIKWTKKIVGLYTINDIIRSSDGKYIVVGQTNTSYQIYISKIDTNASKIWEKELALPNGPHSAYKIVKLKDGNYLVIDHFGGIVVVDENGNIIKTRRELSYDLRFFNGLGGVEGGYLVIGNVTNVTGMFIAYSDFSIARFTKSDDPSATITPIYVLQDQDSSYLISGYIYNKGFIMRLGKDMLNVRWAKIYNEINSIKFISRTSDGNYVAIGNYKPTNDSDQIVIFKMDTIGNVILSKIFKNPYNKTITSAIYENNYIYIISNFKNVNNYDFIIIKTDENLSGICNFQDHNLTYNDFQLNRESVTHSYTSSNSVNIPSTSISNLSYNGYNFCSSYSSENCSNDISISIDGYNLKIHSQYKNEMFYIYDISGNLVKGGYLKENNSISFSKAGIYILKIKSRTYKIIIGGK